MILNLFVVAYVILLAYWLGVQGLFSSFLHVVIVIVSGALAFALWEPISVDMLSGFMPRFAWAVGLVVPFVVFVLLLRFLMDRYVPQNMHFHHLLNLIGGGALGAVAAILSAGVLIIGLSQLPAGASLFGYKTLAVHPNTGQVVEDAQGTGLWISVDSIAAGFFNSLSTGAFKPAAGQSLALLRPDLVREGQLVRLRPDENSSTTVTRNGVSIEAHYAQLTPIAGLPKVFLDNLPTNLPPSGHDDLDDKIRDLRKTITEMEGYKLVVIDTKWKNADMTYDGDPKLRVPPTQIRLGTFPKQGPPRAQLHAPIAFANLVNANNNVREFTLTALENVVNADKVMAEDVTPGGAVVAWVFLIPADQVEQFLRVRHLRLPLSDAEMKLKQTKPQQLAEAIGMSMHQTTTAVANNDGDTPGDGKDNGDNGKQGKNDKGTPGPRKGRRVGVIAEHTEVTADLPRITSKNLATTLDFNNRNEVLGGTAVAQPPSQQISDALKVTRLFTPAGQAMVRIKLTRDLAQSLLGQAVAAAAALNPMIIKDNQGNPSRPIGFVLVQSSGNMQIKINRTRPMRTVRELPHRRMGPKDELYVYFLVKRGVRLISLDIGDISRQDLNQIEVP